jgi:hypothetical protein
MKLLYFGTDFNAVDKMTENFKLIGWGPPEMDAPFWELDFEKNIFLFSDGKIVLIVEDEGVEEKPGDKPTRLKRTVSMDRVLEGQ